MITPEQRAKMIKEALRLIKQASDSLAGAKWNLEAVRDSEPEPPRKKVKAKDYTKMIGGGKRDLDED